MHMNSLSPGTDRVNSDIKILPPLYLPMKNITFSFIYFSDLPLILIAWQIYLRICRTFRRDCARIYILEENSDSVAVTNVPIQLN